MLISIPCNANLNFCININISYKCTVPCVFSVYHPLPAFGFGPSAVVDRGGSVFLLGHILPWWPLHNTPSLPRPPRGTGRSAIRPPTPIPVEGPQNLWGASRHLSTAVESTRVTVTSEQETSSNVAFHPHHKGKSFGNPEHRLMTVQ